LACVKPKAFCRGFRIHKITQNKAKRWKERPVNEISEYDIKVVLQAIETCNGYPKLRELATLVPSIKPLKLNFVIRFLERTGNILIDGDGHIIWTKGVKSEMLNLSDVADISAEFREFLNKHGD
jgi:hypothetical protein